jgi:macrolide-specific efflux system membrane fusion protein
MTRSVFATALAALYTASGGAEPAETIQIPSALVRVIKQVDVPAREAGVLASIHVREGQLVHEGDPLAQIADTEACIALERAGIEVEMAKSAVKNDVDIRFARKSVEVAKAELQRSEESIKKYPKSVSDSEMDRLRLVVQRSELEVEQAEYESEIAEFTRQIKENEYRAAREKVARRKINAPIGGMVVDVQRFQGEWVEPGDTVVRLLRLDRLRVEGFVDAQHVCGALEGAPVRLALDLPDEPGAEFPGRIVFVSPEIDPVNGQIRVWAEIENHQLKLRPGMRATLSIGRETDSPAEN